MNYMTYFDQPMWTFNLPQKDVRNDGIHMVDITIVSEHGRRRQVSVVASSEMYPFWKEVIQAQRFDEVDITLEQVRDRWYLKIHRGFGVIALWYYTQSNLPVWAR